MADGTYERRGPREAELKRFQRLLDERRKVAAQPAKSGLGEVSPHADECEKGHAS